MPIICPTKRRGASVVMALKPTGLSASSPIVWNRYVNTSHVGKTCCPAATNVAAPIMTTKPTPEQHQAERELRRRRRLEMPAREPEPEHRVERREHDQEQSGSTTETKSSESRSHRSARTV